MVIERSGVMADETLFIDDSQANLDASVRFGFETYLAPQNQDFSAIFGL
jgi:putative hydrolase of the HAD superfamily